MKARLDFIFPAAVLAIGLSTAAVSCGSDDDGGGSGGASSGGSSGSGGASTGGASGSGGASSGGSSGSGGASSGGSSGSGGASSGGAGGTGGAGTGGAGTGGAGTGGAGAGIPPDKQNLRVAFFGDTKSGTDFKSVLTLAVNEKADFILGGGDYDYSLNPSAWLTAMNSVLGADYPIFGAVGNHDVFPSNWEPYATEFKKRMQKVGVVPDSPDFTDEKFSIVYHGIKIVFVGQNGKNTEFADYIKQQFATDDHIWRLCVWHKNQNKMQVGGKGDEMGWGVYENCRAAGAIVLTAHEHSYHRTKTLTDMTNQVVDTTCSDPKKVCVGPGRTFAMVSGLGGNDVRVQARCLPATYPYGCKQEWAHIYTSNQSATFGAMLLDFYVGGDPKKAKGTFKNVQNKVVDEFDITKD
ncbi:MAG: metallophosphoesterase [Myxococcales bacterium]|nr:metallophosphoesterase [Myxococcales bacterium]